jgi:AmiR/NasT family two-component response regulator
MDFMIPSWALGVGIIIIAGSIAKVVTAGLTGGLSRRRLRAGLQGADADVSTEVTELRQTVDTLQQRLAEVEERLDFAERLLSKPPR